MSILLLLGLCRPGRKNHYPPPPPATLLDSHNSSYEPLINIQTINFVIKHEVQNIAKCWLLTARLPLGGTLVWHLHIPKSHVRAITCPRGHLNIGLRADAAHALPVPRSCEALNSCTAGAVRP
jgi:hypothetical protein